MKLLGEYRYDYAADYNEVRAETIYQTQLAEKLGCEIDVTKRLSTDYFMRANETEGYAFGDISSKIMGQLSGEQILD